MPRGLGYIPDAIEHQIEDEVERAIVGGPRALLSGSSFGASREWRHLVDRVADQGATNSCVGQWLSNAVYLAGRAAEVMGTGARVKRPSALWSYAIARWKDAHGLLVDDGCQPRSMMLGAQEHGIVAEDRWPFDPADVNVAPPFDADVAGADAHLTGWYGIGAAHASDLMRSALDRGHFPGFAIDVYDNFYDHNGTATYDEPKGEWRGSHMITAVAHRPGAICILNSWSKHWADDGYAWLSDALIESVHVRQRLVITAAPASR
jgi:hypothetical protein